MYVTCIEAAALTQKYILVAPVIVFSLLFSFMGAIHVHNSSD